MKKKINFYHLFPRGFCPHIHTEDLCNYYPDDLKTEKMIILYSKNLKTMELEDDIKAILVNLMLLQIK